MFHTQEGEFIGNFSRLVDTKQVKYHFSDLENRFLVLVNFGNKSSNPPLLISPPPIQFCTPFLKIAAQVPPFGLQQKFSTTPFKKGGFEL